jgi:hypothetical protein
MLTTVGIISGRFQPPHIGHTRSWQWLNNEFDEAFVGTSDKTDPLRSPFNFGQKHALLAHAGIPFNNIVKVTNPYIATEIVERFDSTNTVVVFAVSEKDMQDNPRFDFKPKKDGSAGFLQPYAANVDNLQPVDTHAYVITIPTYDFVVAGVLMTSATQLRNRFAMSDYVVQKQIITDLYGSHNKNIHDLMCEKIG